MNDAHALTAQNLMLVFPEALALDESMVALGRATAAALEAKVKESRELSIYTRIDELPEGLLDILARDFKVDWWDGDFSLEQKRQVLKSSWYVHRTLGTKAGVASAICSIYPDTQVLEWWEYEGQPYHFRLRINSTYADVSPALHRRVLEKVNYYKPLRSVLDTVEYYEAGASATLYAGAACVGVEMVDGATAVRY